MERSRRCTPTRCTPTRIAPRRPTGCDSAMVRLSRAVALGARAGLEALALMDDAVP